MVQLRLSVVTFPITSTMHPLFGMHPGESSLPTHEARRREIKIRSKFFKFQDLKLPWKMMFIQVTSKEMSSLGENP